MNFEHAMHTPWWVCACALCAGSCLVSTLATIISPCTYFLITMIIHIYFPLLGVRLRLMGQYLGAPPPAIYPQASFIVEYKLIIGCLCLMLIKCPYNLVLYLVGPPYLQKLRCGVQFTVHVQLPLLALLPGLTRLGWVGPGNKAMAFVYNLKRLRLLIMSCINVYIL